MEAALVIIGFVALTALAGVLVLAYVLWRDRRRAEDAVDEALAEFADQSAKSGGGGGPTPIR